MSFQLVNVEDQSVDLEGPSGSVVFVENLPETAYQFVIKLEDGQAGTINDVPEGTEIVVRPPFPGTYNLRRQSREPEPELERPEIEELSLSFSAGEVIEAEAGSEEAKLAEALVSNEVERVVEICQQEESALLPAVGQNGEELDLDLDLAGPSYGDEDEDQGIGEERGRGGKRGRGQGHRGRGRGRHGRDRDSDSDEEGFDAEESEDEDEDNDYTPSGRGRGRGRGRPRGSGRGRGRDGQTPTPTAARGGRGRGRGRGQSTSTPSSTRKSERLNKVHPLADFSYEKVEKDPSDLVPPAPPTSKKKSGRRALMRESLPVDSFEGDVQLVTMPLKINSITNRPQVNPATAFRSGQAQAAIAASMSMALVPFGSGATAVKARTTTVADAMALVPYTNSPSLLDQRILRNEGAAQFEAQVASQLAQMRELGDAATHNRLRVATRESPFDLGNILIAEHFIHLFHCVESQERLDSTVWLKSLAEEFKLNPRFAKLKFAESLESGYDPNLVTASVMKHAMISAKERIRGFLTSAESTVLRLQTMVLAKKREIEYARIQKFAILNEYRRLHSYFYSLDAKYDEMSITGMRSVKIMMHPPYFKIAKGLLRFSFQELELPISQMFPSEEKQKWTSKDLQGLKQVIKDVVVSTRMDQINGKYRELLFESERIRKEEMQEDGVPPEMINRPPEKRKRGRPSKEENFQRNKYGKVFPYLVRGEVFDAGYRILPTELRDWRNAIDKQLYNMSYEALLKDQANKGYIDWDEVARRLMLKTKKLRVPDDCRRAFEHEADPCINSKRISVKDTDLVIKLRDTEGKDWDQTTDEVNSKHPYNLPHTSYQYFQKYVAKKPAPKPTWTPEMDEILTNTMKENPGNWNKAVAALKNETITKKASIERYREILSTGIKSGPFSRTEDCLLILTIERLKDFMKDEGHMGVCLSYLPWRYETTWRDRAHNLFHDWIVPWNIEEDKKLLRLAEMLNKNWEAISREFSSFKNRKGCLTRFKILKKNLEKMGSLEQYHEAYSMTRYNVIQYKHLDEVLVLLKRVSGVPVPQVQAKQAILQNNGRPPSEEELRALLICYDRAVVNDAIRSLEFYIDSRQEYYKNWNEKNGGRKRTFDRRTFHPTDPQSVASAIHIRGVELKLKDSVPDLTEFENEVYLHYGRFTRTKSVDKEAKRPHLPPKRFFYEWRRVQRIVASPSEDSQEEEDDEVYSQKWWRLLNEDNGKRKKVTSTKTKTGKKKPDKKPKRAAKAGKEDSDTEEEASSSPPSEDEEDMEWEDAADSDSEPEPELDEDDDAPDVADPYRFDDEDEDDAAEVADPDPADPYRFDDEDDDEVPVPTKRKRTAKTSPAPPKGKKSAAPPKGKKSAAPPKGKKSAPPKGKKARK